MVEINTFSGTDICDENEQGQKNKRSQRGQTIITTIILSVKSVLFYMAG